MLQIIVYVHTGLQAELWCLFSLFFMDNFHGKHVDNMQSTQERTGSFPTYGNLDSCQHVQEHPPGLEEHVQVLLLLQA